MIIDINGIPIEIIKKPIKNMSVRIYPPDGVVKVSAPLSFSIRSITHHLQGKSSWIQSHRDRMRLELANKNGNELLQTGNSIAFQGANYLLRVEEHHGPSHVVIKGELLYLYVSQHATQAQKQLIIDRWYRNEMNLLLPALFQYWEQIIDVTVAQWGIKKMRTRWGSCNTRAHRIWLNLNLMQKSIECLEYVLVHELVHLLEASHNQRFYNLMTQFMPQWRHYQSMLEGKFKNKAI